MIKYIPVVLALLILAFESHAYPKNVVFEESAGINKINERSVAVDTDAAATAGVVEGSVDGDLSGSETYGFGYYPGAYGRYGYGRGYGGYGGWSYGWPYGYGRVYGGGYYHTPIHTYNYW